MRTFYFNLYGSVFSKQDITCDIKLLGAFHHCQSLTRFPCEHRNGDVKMLNHHHSFLLSNLLQEGQLRKEFDGQVVDRKGKSNVQ